MRLRSLAILVLFVAVIWLPFLVQLASGNIFNGISIPALVGNETAGQDSSAVEEYAEGLPKPVLNGAGAQYLIDLDTMRNHPDFLKQKDRSPKQLCSSCHTQRENFCDRCHSFVGVNPSIDY